MTRGQKGQTLAEFGLILPALLMAIFAIIEGGRIFQAYVTVQGASREAARYAITGNWEPGKTRVECIEDVVWAASRGLRIDPSASFDDPYQMIISVFAYDEDLGVVREGYAGAPGEKVTVRVTYNIGLLTPFLSEIAQVIRVTGEAEMVNEAFGEFGNRQIGVVPATMPPLPTLGASPTPSETPTPTDTPTPTNTPDPTATPTPCPPDIIEPLFMSDTVVSVEGEPGVFVEVWDLNDNKLLGSDTFAGSNYCEGWVDMAVPAGDYPDGLVPDHQIAALSAWGNDSARVMGETPTPTPTSTATPTPTSSPTPTATPSTPYIVISSEGFDGPDCMDATGTVNITVTGGSWPTAASRDIVIKWDGSIKVSFKSRASWEVVIGVSADEGTHVVRAEMLDDPEVGDSKDFYVPCGAPTPYPTATPTPTWSSVEILVNSGASEQYVDTLGQTWQPDQEYSEGSWGYYGPTNPRYDAEAVAGTEDDPLYQYYTFRDGLTYIFDVPPSVYDITLKFAEPKWAQSGKRIFDVLLEGSIVVDDLDIYAAAPGKWVAHDRSFSVQVSDGHLDLNLAATAGSPDDPLLSAIGINAVAPTPTPTPIPPPDLIVPWERIAISPVGDLTTYQPITVTVVVENATAGDASNFFWVDVYTSTTPITPTYMTPGMDWTGVSSLGGGDSITLTLRYDEGFPNTGTYYIYALADSWTQVTELEEENNYNLQNITVDVVAQGTPPPTPTLQTGTGAISGYTWIFVPPLVQQGRINIQCYNSSDQLVAETTSSDAAYFRIEGLVTDWYTLIATTTIGSVQYQATRLVQVTDGSETSDVFLILYPV